MNVNISNEIVQLYLPVLNVRESVEWYSLVFGYAVITEHEDTANLKLQHGPLLFMRKVASVNPLILVQNGKDQPIISFKTSDLDRFLNRMKSLEIECGEIITYGEGVNGPYRDLVMYDPNGHLIEVNNYPDLCLPKFRGY